jgi:nitrite reductase/ring-hydroxylating ferredoxin subunit
MRGFVEVAKKSQIPENGVIGVQAQGKALALVSVGGNIYALDDRCPHEAAPLSDGQIEGGEIVCPWHSSRFDVKTGRVTGSGDGRHRHVQGARRRRCRGGRDLRRLRIAAADASDLHPP